MDVVADLFPQADGPALPALSGQPALAVVDAAAAFIIASIVLLLRVPGPVWDAFYAEDRYLFFMDALSRPWHYLFTPYNGYLQLLQRLVAQAATYVPLREAPVVFAFTGAAITSGCALFVFHASAAHIRSARWRALLAATIVLLPVAPIEIADNTVNASWYLILALFWAVLWRPRTRAGMAVSALIAFFTASSVPLAFVFAPLFVARVAVLRRLREHAVTIGWVAGCLLQLPAIHAASAAHQSRLGKPSALGPSLSFYGHGAVLPAFGWHLSWLLRDWVGPDTGTLIVGCVLVAVFAPIIVTQRGRVRLFVVTALLTGLVFIVVASTFSHVAYEPITFIWENGSRYTALPIFLFVCAAVVAVDAMFQRAQSPEAGTEETGTEQTGAQEAGPREGGTRRAGRLRAVAAGTALVVVLCAGWLPDYRYQTGHIHDAPWAPIASRWLRACERPGVRSITVPGWLGARPVIPCANLRR
jgi:hypothetical protein